MRDCRPVKAVAALAEKNLIAVVLERLTEKTDPSAQPPIVVVQRRGGAREPRTANCELALGSSVYVSMMM